MTARDLPGTLAEFHDAADENAAKIARALAELAAEYAEAGRLAQQGRAALALAQAVA